MEFINFPSLLDIPAYRQAVEHFFFAFPDTTETEVAMEGDVVPSRPVQLTRANISLLIKIIDTTIASYQKWYSEMTTKVNQMMNVIHKANRKEIDELTQMLKGLKTGRKEMEKQYKHNTVLPPEERAALKEQIDENIRVSSETMDKIQSLLQTIYIHPAANELYGKALTILSRMSTIADVHVKNFDTWDDMDDGYYKEKFLDKVLDQALNETLPTSNFMTSHKELLNLARVISRYKLTNPKEGFPYPMMEFVRISDLTLKVRNDLAKYIRELKKIRDKAMAWNRKMPTDQVSADTMSEKIKSVKIIMYMVEMSTACVRDRVSIASIVLNTSATK